MSKQTKPSIVFAHGLWADGSCFQKLIPSLQADGHEVICSQHGLDSLRSDVNCVTRCFGRVSGPVVLVGHSYGGTLITHAGTDDRVAALVYIAWRHSRRVALQSRPDALPTECRPGRDPQCRPGYSRIEGTVKRVGKSIAATDCSEP